MQGIQTEADALQLQLRQQALHRDNFTLLSDRATATPAHHWYYNFELAVEQERGLSDREDHLHAATFTVTSNPGESVTLVASTEPPANLNGATALKLRRDHEQKLIARWQGHRPDNSNNHKDTPD